MGNMRLKVIKPYNLFDYLLKIWGVFLVFLSKLLADFNFIK